MKRKSFRVLDYDFDSYGVLPKGVLIYYHCKKCNGLVPSLPKKSSECECGNVFVELESFRAGAFHSTQAEVVEVNPD